MRHTVGVTSTPTCANTSRNAGTLLMQRGSCEERKQPCGECEISLETRLRRDDCEEGRLEVSQQMLFFFNITPHPAGNSLAAPIWRLELSRVKHVFNQIKTKLASPSEKWCIPVWKLFLSVCISARQVKYFLSILYPQSPSATTGSSARFNSLTESTLCRKP